jgi:hypothetical protein
MDNTLDYQNCTPDAFEHVLNLTCCEGLWKIGGSYERLVNVRPFHNAQYSTEYFDRYAVCLVKGVPAKLVAELLESYAIQYTKYVLETGINYKDKDTIPHNGYSLEDPGAIYAVRVRDKYTSPEHFLDEYESYYKMTLGGGLKATGAHIYIYIYAYIYMHGARMKYRIIRTYVKYTILMTV